MRDVMLIVHFIGLAMGVGTSFAFMFLGWNHEKYFVAPNLFPTGDIAIAVSVYF